MHHFVHNRHGIKVVGQDGGSGTPRLGRGRWVNLEMQGKLLEEFGRNVLLYIYVVWRDFAFLSSPKIFKRCKTQHHPRRCISKGFLPDW